MELQHSTIKPNPRIHPGVSPHPAAARYWAATLAALLAALVLVLAPPARSDDRAEGSAIDAELLRWQREKRFFETETRRIRNEIEALKAAQPATAPERRRQHHKWIRLTASYFETMSGHYASHGRFLDYSLEKYGKGAEALGAAIEESKRSDAELREGMAEVVTQKRKALRVSLLADEINKVLREPVTNTTVYEQMLEIADQNLAGFREILAGFEQSSRRWAMDKMAVEAEIGRIEVARNLAATLETLYARSASAYQGIGEIDSIDVLDDLNVESLLAGVEHPGTNPHLDLPPATGLVSQAGGSSSYGFRWHERLDEYDALGSKVDSVADRAGGRIEAAKAGR